MVQLLGQVAQTQKNFKSIFHWEHRKAGHAPMYRCACPHMHIPFCCSDRLHCAFFSSRKSVRSAPACPFHLKCRVWACVFTSFCCFTWVHVCAPFQHRSWAHTCRGIIGEEIPGWNYAQNCTCRHVYPWGSPRQLRKFSQVLASTCLVFVFCLFVCFPFPFVCFLSVFFFFFLGTWTCALCLFVCFPFPFVCFLSVCLFFFLGTQTYALCLFCLQ